VACKFSAGIKTTRAVRPQKMIHASAYHTVSRSHVGKQESAHTMECDEVYGWAPHNPCMVKTGIVTQGTEASETETEMRYRGTKLGKDQKGTLRDGVLDIFERASTT
jgi:hypothetical protein